MRGAACLAALLLCAGAACADERSAALVQAFHDTCIAEPPVFSRIAAKALAENLAVTFEVGRREEGPFNHSKSWMVPLATGTHELTAAEARGPAGELASCAITAPDGIGEEVKRDLMQALNLGPAEREAVSPDGQRRSSGWYLKRHTESMILLLIDGSPSSTPGIHLNVTRRFVAGS